MRIATAGALVLALLGGSAWGQVNVPPLTARVMDFTGTLTSEHRAALEDKLAQLERAKGSQIAVLIVPTTQPETIEQYGIRVGDQWKLGRKGVDDGAILIVAKEDRRMRIEVGYGLEGALSDAICKRIISETITPAFKRGNLYEGIDAGITQMIAVVSGEPLPEPPRHRSTGSGHSGNWNGLITFLFFGVFFVAPILRLIFGRTLGGVFAGGVAAFVAYLFTGLLIVAIIAGVLGLFLALTAGFAPRRWSSGGGWGGGFPGGFSSGGGFGGGGGFSGGGGSFGGGGASGSW